MSYHFDLLLVIGNGHKIMQHVIKDSMRTLNRCQVRSSSYN